MGYSFGLAWYTNLIVSIIGNMLPVPFILVFILKIFEMMKKKNIMVNFIEKIEKKANQKVKMSKTKSF